MNWRCQSSPESMGEHVPRSHCIGPSKSWVPSRKFQPPNTGPGGRCCRPQFCHRKASQGCVPRASLRRLPFLERSAPSALRSPSAQVFSASGACSRWRWHSSLVRPSQHNMTGCQAIPCPYADLAVVLPVHEAPRHRLPGPGRAAESWSVTALHCIGQKSSCGRPPRLGQTRLAPDCQLMLSSPQGSLTMGWCCR